MAKRMIIMLCAVIAFLAIIGIFKFRQVQAAIAQASSYQPAPEAVTTLVTRQDRWQQALSAIGTVAAVKGVTLSADLPGIVESINFESGKSVKAGTPLVRLDARQEQAQLVAAEADRELTRLNFERARDLLEDSVLSRAEYDAAEAAHNTAKARVGEIRATIDRKVIRAPFGGILGIRRVDLGQYLNSGDPVVSLQSLDPIYVNFAVPQQELGQVKPGVEVRLTAEGARAVEGTGRITAIDSIVEEATRNVMVQATFANPGGALRPGMFVRAEVVLDSVDRVIPVPGSAIVYAPYGNSVYVVQDLKGEDGRSYKGVRQHFVKLGPTRGDQVAVLSGIEPGDEVVTSGGFKLRNGAAVLVNNEVQPANSPTPTPEDN